MNEGEWKPDGLYGKTSDQNAKDISISQEECQPKQYDLMKEELLLKSKYIKYKLNFVFYYLLVF